MSVYRTASGKYLDINALKIQQEKTIAVGNSKQNARGDLLGEGGKIVKTRDEMMKEFYNNQRRTQLSDNKVYSSTDEANQVAVADIFSEPQPITNGIDDITASKENNIEVVENKIPVASTGGINDAISKSQELAERLRNQRRRI